MSAPVDPGEPQRLHAEVRARINALADVDLRVDLARSLHHLCADATTHLALMGAAVNLMSATGADGVVASSGPRFHELAEFEFTVGEGPAIQAFTERRPVLVPDLRGTAMTRWPGYASGALDAGVAAVFALPLQVGAVCFGVLDLYADSPGPLGSDRTALAATYAQIGTETLLDGEATMADGQLVPSLARALDYRGEIAQAQGMVMVDLGVSLTDALVRLRAHAFTYDEELIAVARKVIGGYRLPGLNDA